MTIVINGTSGITGVPAIGSDAADTAVILNDSGTNSNTCRAWVNFNGTGTVAIRADFNVSSITDNGTGDYTVNFTTAMPDANFTTVATSINTSFTVIVSPQTTTTAQIRTNTVTPTLVDVAIVGVAFFR